MTNREKEQRAFMYKNLHRLGFSFDDCESLRRISMTLRRWYELECGTENDHGSNLAIERGSRVNGEFISDPDGKPFMRCGYVSGDGKYRVTHNSVADRETGAIKRLNAITAPLKRKLCYYLQTDPRGAALYIVPYAQLRRYGKTKGQIDCCYTSVGICVY
jgi:hypothetical protein